MRGPDGRTGRRPCPAGSASTRSPRPTTRPSATGSRSSRRRRPGHRGPAVIAAILPRRIGVHAHAPPTRAGGRRAPRRRAGHRGERRRRLHRRRPRPRLQPAPPRALPRGRLVERRHAVIVLNKADLADDLEGRLVAVEAIAPGVPVVVLSALTGDQPRRPAAAPATGPDRGRAGLVGRRQVDARQRAPRRGAPGHGRRPRGRLARPPHDHPPRAVRAARRRAARSTPRASARSRSPAPTRASRPPSTTSSSSPRHAASATAGTTASRAARSEAALAAGTLSAGPARQPPQARARAGPRGPRDRPAGACRAPAQVADHPQVRRRAHAAQVRRTTDDRHRGDQHADRLAGRCPGAPPVPGLRVPRVPRPGGLRADVARDVRGARADDIPWLPTADHLRIENEGDDGISPPTTSSSPRSTAWRSRSAGRDRVVRDGVPTYEIWGSIDPVARRRGIGTALFARNLARVHERAATIDPGLPVVIGTDAEDGQEGDRILAETNGFEPVRSFYLMRRDLSAPIPDAPLPDGHRAPAGDRGPASDDLRRPGRGVPRPLGPPRGQRARLRGDLRPQGAGHRALGGRLGGRRGRRRRRELDLGRRERSSSASSAAGSRRSASAGRGAGRASPGRSSPSRSGGSATRA